MTVNGTTVPENFPNCSVPVKVMKLLYGMDGKPLNTATFQRWCDDAGIKRTWSITRGKKTIRCHLRTMKPSQVQAFVHENGLPGVQQ